MPLTWYVERGGEGAGDFLLGALGAMPVKMGVCAGSYAESIKLRLGPVSLGCNKRAFRLGWQIPWCTLDLDVMPESN